MVEIIEKLQFEKPDTESLKKLKELYFKIDRTSIETAKLFVFFSNILNINNLTIIKMTPNLNKLAYFIEQSEKDEYGNIWFVKKIEDIIEKYRKEISLVIRRTNEMCELFKTKKDEDDFFGDDFDDSY